MVATDQRLTRRACSRANPEVLWPPGHCYSNANVADRDADPLRRLVMLPDLAADGSGWSTECFCDTWDAAGRELRRIAKVVLAAASCQGRAGATADAPEAPLMSSSMSSTVARAMPWMVINSPACCERHTVRSVGAGRLDGKQGRGGAHPAAQANGARVFSRTASSWRTGVDFPHGHGPSLCGNPLAARIRWTQLENTRAPSSVRPCQLIMTPPVLSRCATVRLTQALSAARATPAPNTSTTYPHRTRNRCGTRTRQNRPRNRSHHRTSNRQSAKKQVADGGRRRGRTGCAHAASMAVANAVGR